MSDADPNSRPGSVSNQNHEEAQPGHDPATTQPHSGSDRDDERQAAADRRRQAGRPLRDEGAAPGGASEGSQSTGHPDNAG